MVRSVFNASSENSWPFRPLAFLVSSTLGFRSLFKWGLRSSHGQGLDSGHSPSVCRSLEDRTLPQLPTTLSWAPRGLI